jgi:hypothetical protein
MPIKDYTTTIDPTKTIGEIQSCLAKNGAKKITVDYQDNMPIVLTFSIEINNVPIGFSLPCKYEGVLKTFKRDGVKTSLCTKEQAIRTAWRIIKDWIEAQMAIVQANQAELAEVFLPYAITKDGQTVYEQMKSGNGKMISLQ